MEQLTKPAKTQDPTLPTKTIQSQPLVHPHNPEIIPPKLPFKPLLELAKRMIQRRPSLQMLKQARNC